jgi:hypothetical protein
LESPRGFDVKAKEKQKLAGEKNVRPNRGSKTDQSGFLQVSRGSRLPFFVTAVVFAVAALPLTVKSALIFFYPWLSSLLLALTRNEKPETRNRF